MSITLSSVVVVRARRVRMYFTSPLAAGAFDPSLYTVTSSDAVASAINVRAVYAVAGTLSACELVLGSDLVDNINYLVTAVGVPAQDATVTPGGTGDYIRFAKGIVLVNREALVTDNDLILYGRDIVHNGTDFQETADGDLATIAGLPNVNGALMRRLMGSPLPYAPQYSPDARQYVDSNTAAPLKNRIREQVLRDGRVKAVSVSLVTNADDTITFLTTATYIGDQTSPPIPVSVQI